MYYKELVTYANDTIKKYPKLKKRIFEIVLLAKSEIAMGESIENECQLAKLDIQELIESHTK